MNTSLKYVPFFRGRQEELKVIQSFEFGDNIYPLLEIVKKTERTTKSNKPLSKKAAFDGGPFTTTYQRIIGRIKAKKVFIDLPLYQNSSKKKMSPDIAQFQLTIRDMQHRITLIKSLDIFSERVIPVISSYFQITGESQTIAKQAKALRSKFPILAFRTFRNSFQQDKDQIIASIQSCDYLIMDWEEDELDLNELDIVDIVNNLAKFNCHVIAHRNPYPTNFTHSNIADGNSISEINNDHLVIYRNYSGASFSDYAGIKKSDTIEGGTISPAFIFYDGVQNEFYGYRYRFGGHKKGQRKPELTEFKDWIIPCVLKSGSSTRMASDPRNFLSVENKGWAELNNIMNTQSISGKNQALFKRISMHHYLHCMKAKISHGDFD